MSAIAVAVVGGVAAVGGALIQANAAETAAGEQAQSSANALGFQQQMYNQTVGNEKPFVQAGQGAQSQLNYLLGIGPTTGSSSAGGYGSLNAPFNADTFKSMSPAYQFQLQQGAQGTLNQDASSQGALSGSALKDLTSFNQNYANTSFNNAFSQYQTQQNNTFNRLNSVAQTGQAAASNQATGASSFANSIGNSATNIGNAQAGGAVGVGNALSGALSGAASSASLPWLLQGMNDSSFTPTFDTSNPGIPTPQLNNNLVGLGLQQ